MINKWKYSKLQNWAKMYIKELQNAHQKIAQKILGKLMKFWL